jgi:hypothetical protein
VRDVATRPQRELEPGLEVEESDRAMLEFRPDDAVRGEPQPVAVEGDGSLQVVDAQGSEG